MGPEPDDRTADEDDVERLDADETDDDGDEHDDEANQLHEPEIYDVDVPGPAVEGGPGGLSEPGSPGKP